ncbi:MAG TPA: SDR family oxidoreductase [Acidimicrobiia bacterium]|nr:SDR family oxidoreductase [Acidimicrobiia bacterium]
MSVVVVTGGSAGVGRAVASAFAARGDRVAIVARDEARLELACKELDALGAAQAAAYPVDVSEWSALDQAADKIEYELGPIDIWVNDAMASVFAPFWEITPEEFARVTAVTYLGYANGTRAALARMRPRNSGHIIQVGSALAYRGIPLQSAYCGAKHGIKGFTESVRTELMHERSAVLLTMVHLPAVNTPQFEWVLSRLPRRPRPVPPVYEPEVIARAVVHASTTGRREYWIGWSCIRAILGERVMPDVLDRVLARIGFDSQQTNEPVRADRPSNLWEPVAGDYGAHGRFDNEARRRSVTNEAAAARDRVLRDTHTQRLLDRAADRLAAAMARFA